MTLNEKLGMINIILNEEFIPVAKGCTVDRLMEQLSIKDLNRVAVAVNELVVVRSNWTNHQLYDKDQVMMFAPISGG